VPLAPLDLDDPDVVADPYPAFARARAVTRTSRLEPGAPPIRRPEFVLRGLASLPVVLR
jgi:hypothetical protein